MELMQNKNLMIGVLGVTLLILFYNSYQIGQINGVTAYATKDVSFNALSNMIPTGIPKVYGEELGVKYDDVSANNQNLADQTIDKLGKLDNELTLNDEQLQRYINILYKLNNGISCEYCCGARSIIFENGQPACGCAHSYAMRGLTKYLLINHGNEYSDEEILGEVGKWKVLFFPTQMTQKAKIMEENKINVDYVTLASNQYRGIEKSGGSSGGMVGGC